MVEHPKHQKDIVPLSPEEQELRLYEGVGTLVHNLSQQQPLVMFLDDLHLAAQMNLQLHVARRLKEFRLLIIYAYREDELLERANLVAGRNELIRSRVVTEVRLAPLTESETGMMISHSFGSTAAAQLQAPIYAINRGNPFFVEEVLRFLVENKAVRRVEGRWEVLDITRLGIPESVKLLVQERVSRLGEDGVAMLQQASVLGGEFSFAALSLMANLPEDRLVAMIDHTLAAGLLVDRTLSPTEELYSFQEDHFREALYETIPATRRRRYHLQAGHALRKLYPSRLDELAYHFTHGSDATLGADYSYQAAEKSNSLFNWGRAIPLYQDALDLWEEQGGNLAERAASAENLGSACYKSGINVRQAVGYFEQALSFYVALDNHRKAATIHSQLGREHMHSGNIAVQDLTLALEHFDRAEALLGTASQDIPHGLIYCGRALAHLDRLDLDSSVSWAQKALDVGERVGSPSVIANACSPLGSVLGHSTVGQAREALERAWQMSSEGKLGFQADLSRACGARVLGVVLKDPRAGFGWAERGPDYGTTYSLFDIPSHLVALFALRGQFDDASRVLGELQSLLRVSGQPVFGLWPDELGVLWIRKGDWEHAESQLTDALDWSVASKNRLMEASTSQKLGEVCLALGRYSDSERHLNHSLNLFSESGSVVGELAVVPHLCELYRRTGRYTEANETLIKARKAIGKTTDWGALWGDLRLEEALVAAGLGSWQDGEEYFKAAVQLYQEYVLPWDEARAYYEWAIALNGLEQDGPHGDRARTLLAEAMALWEPMGASKYVERCRAALAGYS